jgi:porphobilinogen synthase
MIMAGVRQGWLDHAKAMLESLTCFKRAGAAGVLSYFSVDAAGVLKAGL